MLQNVNPASLVEPAVLLLSIIQWKILTSCLFIWYCLFVCLVEFNATFNDISVILWRSVLLVEDPKKTTDLSQVTDKLYHNGVHLALIEIRTHSISGDRH
jgi:hypothetical protein